MVNHTNECNDELYNSVYKQFSEYLDDLLLSFDENNNFTHNIHKYIIVKSITCWCSGSPHERNLDDL